MIRIQVEDFSVEEEMARLTANKPKVGGIVAFVGTVRDYTADDDVVAMVLEHYPGMTESELTKIETAAMARFDLEAVSVVHRVGRLEAGENIVLVLAAARHRADAFEACRYVIDHLKVHATFWKREILSSGEEKWVESCPGCEAAASQWETLRHVPHAHSSNPKGKSGPKSQEGGAVVSSPSHSHAHGVHPQNHHPHHARQSLWAGLKVGLLTLSDSRTVAQDKSGDALEGEVLALGGVVAVRRLLADDQQAIEGQLETWADDHKLDVILTTGGTGPGPRDVTPEATRRVCDRELPGFAEQIRAEGLKQVRTALFTRGVTAFRGMTLVINLPGSTRGAVHSLGAVADLVPHALGMARGRGHG